MKKIYILGKKKEIKNVRATGGISRKSQEISPTVTFLLPPSQWEVIWCSNKARVCYLLITIFTWMLYMGTSYSGNAGQILTLTLWNLWFKTKKVWGSKHWEKRLSSNFYPISELTAEDGTEHRGEFSCTESSAKPNVPSALYLLPSVNPALCLQGDHKNRT